MHPLEKAAFDLEQAAKRLRRVHAQGAFTIKELREIRTSLLETVRNNIDSYAIGHAPNKRHY